ncbi:NAD(P)H-dependent oxidoreductase [Magnetospirillum moscoviense]|uniref:Flagellar biosynthesis protein FlgA n=1 Tax=Magnetospirillum moscoviense TaxID=1437059 RepID=A0A178MSR4_9PROT|nr:SAF domain-containing protein [Magnetospirillum moscoviense]OAN52791.1 flagellar biosynthesis protein FlgA [Magnetospirillum moscoviense]
MSLSALLAARAADGNPIRVGLIGAGRFATQFLAQARHIPGLHVAAVADTESERAHTALALTLWPPTKVVARSLADAIANGSTWVTHQPLALTDQPGLEVIVEASGSAALGIRHAQAAIAAGIHVVMANVDCDALAGPLLARQAADRGVIYSLAYGDQPALVCELVDWARACGFEIAAAGKGTKWLPGYQATTPDTVWSHVGITAEKARAAGMEAKVYTAHVDGTRSALEMAAVANATGLTPPGGGLTFPPCGHHDLARVMKPSWDGGRLERLGQIEVVSSEERDGRHVVGDLRWGVWLTFCTSSDYATGCFADYGLTTDDSGRYSARWRSHRLVGMELAVSVINAVVRSEHTGCPQGFSADVVAVAKRDLAATEILDGAGGFTVWGRLLPAMDALAQRAVPIGLTEGAVMRRPLAAGQVVTWEDVLVADNELLDLRRRMEAQFAG